MARTPSNMIELGSDLPNFNLINTINNELFDSEVLNLNLLSKNTFYEKSNFDLLLLIKNSYHF